MKSRRISCVGLVAHMGDQKMRTGFWWGYLMERDHLKGLDLDWSVILKGFKDIGLAGVE
jgi:hypothetical protein